MKKSSSRAKTGTSRTRINVIPKAGEWAVRKSGSDRASGIYTTQKAALQAAREFVRSRGGGEVTVHGRDGRIRDVDTYSLGASAFGKVSAIEGIYLTKEMKQDFAKLNRQNLSPAERRRRLIAKYGR